MQSELIKTIELKTIKPNDSYGFKKGKAPKPIRVQIHQNGCWRVISHKPHKSLGYVLIKRHGEVMLLHRIIYEEQVGPIPAGLYVCHTCDVRDCINKDHLFLGTHLDNIRDMLAKNRHPTVGVHGEANPISKLTEGEVVEILALRGLKTQKEIASQYGISRRQVGHIHKGDCWIHISHNLPGAPQ